MNYIQGPCGQGYRVIDLLVGEVAIGVSSTVSVTDPFNPQPTYKTRNLELVSDPANTAHIVKEFVEDDQNQITVTENVSKIQLKNVLGQKTQKNITFVVSPSFQVAGQPAPANSVGVYSELTELKYLSSEPDKDYVYVFLVKAILKTGETVFVKIALITNF